MLHRVLIVYPTFIREYGIAPSRSPLMTAMHTGHTVVEETKEIQPEGQYPIPDNTYTLAEPLKKADLHHRAFGENGAGFPGSGRGDPVNQGFDIFLDDNCQRWGIIISFSSLVNMDSIVLKENMDKGDGIYAPGTLYIPETLKFLEDNTTEKKSASVAYTCACLLFPCRIAAPEAYMKKHRGKYPPEKTVQWYDDGPEFNLGPYRSQKIHMPLSQQ